MVLKMGLKTLQVTAQDNLDPSKMASFLINGILNNAISARIYSKREDGDWGLLWYEINEFCNQDAAFISSEVAASYTAGLIKMSVKIISCAFAAHPEGDKNHTHVSATLMDVSQTKTFDGQEITYQ